MASDLGTQFFRTLAHGVLNCCSKNESPRSW